MKKIPTLLLFLCFLIASQAQNNLKFRADGRFKIVQFTDLHFNNPAEKGGQTLDVMRKVLKAEKPDFVIMTGDLVVGKENVKNAYIDLTKPIVEAGVAWTVVFGNHDVETSLTKTEIYSFLQSLPNFAGQANNLSGVGNNMLTIQAGKSGKAAAALFMLDSHAYPADPSISYYDWIKFDQVNWYRNESDKLAHQNNGKPLPSLMFFHIPLIEFEDLATQNKEIKGMKKEGVSSAKINSGLFASMLEKQNVMGVFVGHDHDNDYIGIKNDISLGYGRRTGFEAYGNLERGARVIELTEGRRQFKSWVWTPQGVSSTFYYPSGFGDITKDTAILPAINVKPTKHGVSYTYYEGNAQTTADIAKLQPKDKGNLPNFSLSPAKLEDHFAFTFESYIFIPETDFYRFYTYSDDGSTLYIDGKLVVDNDGGHSTRHKTGIVALEKGFHALKVFYFEDYMGQELKVGFIGRYTPEKQISDDMLYMK